MITFLEGLLEEKQPGRAVINTGGVGYEVLVPLSSFDRLPPEGAKTRILIYHHITEVSQVLFGFPPPISTVSSKPSAILRIG